MPPQSTKAAEESESCRVARKLLRGAKALVSVYSDVCNGQC